MDWQHRMTVSYNETYMYICTLFLKTIIHDPYNFPFFLTTSEGICSTETMMQNLQLLNNYDISEIIYFKNWTVKEG